MIGIKPSQCGPSGRNSRQFTRGGLSSRPTCQPSNITSWLPTVMTIAWCRRAIRTTWLDRLPNATLRIYPDAGHGGIFQFHERFVGEALEFLGS